MSEDLQAEGFTPSASFTQAVQKITALNVFARAFSVWMARHDRSVSLTFKGHVDGSVEFNLGMPPGSTAEQADELLELLEQCQRMADLEAIVSEMRASGQSAEVVQNYILEAETIARQLFPR